MYPQHPTFPTTLRYSHDKIFVHKVYLELNNSCFILCFLLANYQTQVLVERTKGNISNLPLLWEGGFEGEETLLDLLGREDL